MLQEPKEDPQSQRIARTAPTTCLKKSRGLPGHYPVELTGRQKGMFFLEVWFWRMCPCSGFRSGGTCERRTLVPVFVPGEHPNVSSFRFSFRRNIRQNHPFGRPPFCQPARKTRVLRQIAPESSPERLAKSLSHSFFVAPCLSPNAWRLSASRVNLRLQKGKLWWTFRAFFIFCSGRGRRGQEASEQVARSVSNGNRGKGGGDQADGSKQR